MSIFNGTINYNHYQYEAKRDNVNNLYIINFHSIWNECKDHSITYDISTTSPDKLSWLAEQHIDKLNKKTTSN